MTAHEEAIERDGGGGRLRRDPRRRGDTCPLLIKQLTERVEKLSDNNFKKGRAQKLIAEAQKLHDQGKHAESMQMVEDAVSSLR